MPDDLTVADAGGFDTPPELRCERFRKGLSQMTTNELCLMLLGEGWSDKGPLIAEILLKQTGGLGALLGDRGLDPSGPMAALEAVDVHASMRLIAALELGRRASGEYHAMRIGMGSQQPVVGWARAELGHLQHEELWMLALDAGHGLLGARRVSQGGESRCSTTAAAVLRPAILLGARALILVHNHPSGDTDPSPEDIAMTVEMKRACEAVGVPLVDHVIISRSGHCSMFARGLL